MPIYLNQTDYPNLDLSVIGALDNKVYGELKNVPVHGIVTGATSILAAAITAVDTSLTVSDASRYPAVPFTVQINEEHIRVTSKAAAVFTVTRGYNNTEAVSHNATQTVFEIITEYVYKINDGPIKEVAAVNIDGIKQLAANYTIYTGQAGDSHSDWPDIGVVAFSAAAYIGRQYNITTSGDLAVETKNGWVEFASHPELSVTDRNPLVPDTSGSIWDIIIGTGGAGATTSAFVKFAADYGAINTQTYFIDVENASLDLETIDVDVMITEGADLKLLKSFSIPKNQTITLEVSRAGGVFDDVLRILSGKSELIVKNMRKEVFISQAVQTAADLTVTQEVAVLQQFLTVSPIRFVTYPDTALGSSISRQTHVVELIDSSDDDFFNLSISAVEKDGTLLATKEMILSGSAGLYGSLTHAGGSYDTATVVAINNMPPSKIANVKIKKLIEYNTDVAVTETSLAATSSGKIVIGNQITVDAKFAVDTTGDYGGAGNLIQRPDWVIKHFLVNVKGAALADIDTASFSAAGALYATASYELNFLGTLSIDEDQMAEECRSVVYMTQGKYYLDYVPDTAPAASVIIPEGDVIDAPGFMYDHGKIEDLHTDYTARYGLSSEGTWAGVVTAVDAGNKHGIRIKRIDLALITTEAMAQSVLNNILLQHKDLYFTVRFKVSWKYQDLQIGDTFQVSCSLHDGERFFVEKLKINDDNTLSIEGKQWW